MQAQFISGLPAQLAFFIRARNPVTLEEALASAKLGETFGYKLTSAMPSTVQHVSALPKYQPEAPAPSSSSSELAEIRATLRDLTGAIQRLQVNQVNHAYPAPVQQAPRQQNEHQDKCDRCQAYGHVASECNIKDNTSARFHFTCSICHQRGHGSKRCKKGN